MDTVLGVEYNGGGRYLWRLYVPTKQALGRSTKETLPTTNGGLLSGALGSVRVDFVVLLCQEEEGTSSLTLCLSIV